MKKILFAAALALLSACSTTTIQTRYYTLAPEPQFQAATPTPYTLSVKKFAIDPAYAQTNIVYRESPYDFMSYNNDMWASSPEYQVTSLVADNFKQSRLFQKVELRASAMPDLELSGFVTAIEEVDESERYAHVTLELSLHDLQKDSTLWKKNYDEKEPLESHEPRAIAKSASKLLNRYTANALSEIEKTLRP